jgi:hypothetical protein
MANSTLLHDRIESLTVIYNGEYNGHLFPLYPYCHLLGAGMTGHIG